MNLFEEYELVNSLKNNVYDFYSKISLHQTIKIKVIVTDVEYTKKTGWVVTLNRFSSTFTRTEGRVPLHWFLTFSTDSTDNKLAHFYRSDGIPVL